MFGHHGRILRVDLGAGSALVDSFDDDFARRFLGGNGFAAKLISDGVPPSTEPLDDANALVFTVGPLTNTRMWGTGRGHLAGISPQTGLFVDSNFGGKFAVAQKRSGFDAIYITGTSEEPVYVLVNEDGAEFKDASELWGKTTEETNRILQEREGKDAVAASIGPAGENGVIFANVICGGKRSGAAGRGGLGSVMGSKKLKAVVATGNRATQVARPDELQAFLKSHLAALREKTAVLTESGTPSLVTVINAKGLLATHNASREVFEHADDIGAEALKEQYVVRNTACHGCPVACGKLVKMPPGEYAGRNMKMPEYETIFAMGPMLDNRDLSSIINANGICDLYGMDTISMGVTLAFVAECMERGLVTEQDLGGRVDFEDGPGMVEWVRATSRCEGIGALLALGSERLAERFGSDAKKYLYSVKGLEVPGHSARGLRMMSIGYANATRGGSHHDTRADYSQADTDPGFAGQAAYSVRSQNFTAAGDSLVLCRFIEEKGFGTRNNQPIAQVLNAVTGWNMTPDELDVIGERIVNLERLINVRRGVSRVDDVLPHRTMTEPIPDGPAKGRYCPREELDAMLDEYYRLRGWTAEGVPSEQKLAELGLA